MIILTAVIAVTTVIYSAVTLWMVFEMRATRISQSDPCVVVYPMLDESRPGIMLLMIENIGRGMAHRVRFQTSRPVPEFAFGITTQEAPEIKPMTTGPICRGIPALGPGVKLRICWGQYGGLLKSLGEKELTITVNCQSELRELPPVICPIDIRAFEGVECFDTDGGRQSAEQLQRLNDQLQSLINPDKDNERAFPVILRS